MPDQSRACLDSCQDPSSFRDPSGVVFRGQDGMVYRQVNRSYEPTFQQLIESGLYKQLVAQGHLIEHEEAPIDLALSPDASCVIRPRQLSFISYPYEWCFSALKEAALLTLDIQLQSLKSGMSLKDASAYNIQFEGAKPIFIDTLSFEPYIAGAPWVAYGQFCRHFLAPLALMSKTDIGLNRLLSLYIDGIPLDLTSKLLPRRTQLSPGLLVHIHLQARMVRRYADTSEAEPKAGTKSKSTVSLQGLVALLGNLKNTVKKLRWQPDGTEWSDYYSSTSYSVDAFEKKRDIVREFLKRAAPATVWDLGANTGVFSRLASELGAQALAFDIDPACVERNFLAARKESQQQILPLLLDLSNPTPSIGWAEEERLSLRQRGPADVVMALALIHHLRISNNVPFPLIADYFRRLGRHLVVEFVPITDPQVKRLLRSRENIFSDYTQEGFEAAFKRHYSILKQEVVGTDGRILYLMTQD